MKRDTSIKIGDYLKKAGDSVWYAQQVFRKEGETRCDEICQEIIDRILALRFHTITLEKKEKDNDKQ